MRRVPVVYIMASKKNGTLYTGVTSQLLIRVYQHKMGIKKKSFTSIYACVLLVYYEVCRTMRSAIEREKTIKGGSRQKKLDLINEMNPEWRDLFDDINTW